MTRGRLGLPNECVKEGGATLSTSYDLTVERWVPVIRGDGRPGLASLEEAMLDAHVIAGLDHSDPLVAVALYRLLVALARDVADEGNAALVDQREWERALGAGRFDEEVARRYFVKWRDRFDLFGEHPFYQVAGLEAVSGEVKSVSLLLPASATGNNVPLFAAMLDSALPGLRPEEAARRVVACHAWDTAAIKTGAKGDPRVSAGKTTGNPTGPLGSLGAVIPLGRTLFETILLSWMVGPQGTEDLPAWRRDHTAIWSERLPSGPKDLLTWQSRRIKLIPSWDAAGQLHADAVIVAAGDRLPFSPPELEPHTLWRASGAAKAGVAVRPVRHQSGKSSWRGLGGILAGRLPNPETGISTSGALVQLAATEALPYAYPLNLLLVGVVYGNQSAVIETVIVDELPMPVQALHEDDQLRGDLETLATNAEACIYALNDLDANLRRSMGGDPTPWDKGQRPGDRLAMALDDAARRVLRGIQREPERADEGLLAWEHFVLARAWEIANPLLDACSDTAFLGRPDPRHRDRFLRQSTAEAFFRRSLRLALVRAHPQETKESQ